MLLDSAGVNWLELGSVGRMISSCGVGSVMRWRRQDVAKFGWVMPAGMI